MGFTEGVEDKASALADGQMEIALTFSYDINGILDVTAKVLATGQEKRVSIVSANNPLTPEEIEKRRTNVKKIGFADNEENKAVLALAMRIYEESIGTVRKKAEEILYYFNSVLKTNSPIKIKKARESCLPVLRLLDAYVNRDVFEPEWDDGGDLE